MQSESDTYSKPWLNSESLVLRNPPKGSESSNVRNTEIQSESITPSKPNLNSVYWSRRSTSNDSVSVVIEKTITVQCISQEQ